MRQPVLHVLFFSLGTLLLGAAFSTSIPQVIEEPWKTDWGVLDGFALDLDTDGYNLPSSLAFVPEPGDDPKDPLYFVTELRGTVKVVSNDRTVSIFAKDFFPGDPDLGLVDVPDEFGLAGICLAPLQGFVFVTFTYEAEDGKLRNNVMRFSTSPGIFDLQPTSQMAFTEVFEAYPTGASHQIGNCQVDDDLLYVGVGDGLSERELPSPIDVLRGKVLRLTLDGNPAPQNPFYDSEDDLASPNYVWATGFRNPFGIQIVNGRVFVAENGKGIDRFLEIKEGQDYLWNGDDFSIGAIADVVFYPTIGPTQMTYYPAEREGLLEIYQGTFFVGATGSMDGIINIAYDFTKNRVTQVPEYFLRSMLDGNTHYIGMVVGVAAGPDGLYFAPLLPNSHTSGAVFRISYDPENAHPYRVDDELTPLAFLYYKGCLGCHNFDGDGGTTAPSLDPIILTLSVAERLNSPAYFQSLDEIDQREEEPYSNYIAARRELRTTSGVEQMRIWVAYHILEPKFDNPQTQMPNQGLTLGQAELLANFLIPDPSDLQNIQEDELDAELSPLKALRAKLPTVGYRHLPFVFLLGILAALGGMWVYNKRKK